MAVVEPASCTNILRAGDPSLDGCQSVRNIDVINLRSRPRAYCLFDLIGETRPLSTSPRSKSQGLGLLTSPMVCNCDPHHAHSPDTGMSCSAVTDGVVHWAS